MLHLPESCGPDAQIRSEIDIEDESFQSLKASIRDWNVMAPIILMRMEKGYRLIAGERRRRACRELGLPTIPARIRDMEGNREEKLGSGLALPHFVLEQ